MSDRYDIYTSDFNDFSKLRLSKNKSKYFQPTAFINTTDRKKLAIKTEQIKITSNGIPRLNNSDECLGYCVNDTQREFINFPLDPNQTECLKLEKMLELADNYFGSIAVKKKLFGRRHSEYEYLSIIKNKYYGPNKNIKKTFFKIKFPIYISDRDRMMNLPININNKEIIVKSVTELTKYVKYSTTANFTFCFNKIWEMKDGNFNNKFNYSVGLSMVRIDIDQICLIDTGIYLCAKADLKKAYKEYMDDKKDKITNRYTIIEI
jgi:hypothetical protein